MAVRRIPLNQYRCARCGHNHVLGSRRGQVCGQVPRRHGFEPKPAASTRRRGQLPVSRATSVS